MMTEPSGIIRNVENFNLLLQIFIDRPASREHEKKKSAFLVLAFFVNMYCSKLGRSFFTRPGYKFGSCLVLYILYFTENLYLMIVHIKLKRAKSFL
jgi:hypothetical protein